MKFAQWLLKDNEWRCYHNKIKIVLRAPQSTDESIIMIASRGGFYLKKVMES